MDLKEITDSLIDHLMLRMPTDRDNATEAVLLCVAWLSMRGFLCPSVTEQGDSPGRYIF